MPESRSKHPLVWIDCEMTGLDVPNDTILSLACFVTDADCNLLDEEGYIVEVHHEQSALEAMGEWCTETHKKSGLWDRCLQSQTNAHDAAHGCLAYIKKYVPERRKALLAGNTVHMDKAFLSKVPWNPIVRYLHHRILDVSAIKEAMKRWSPDDVIKGSPAKQGLHDAKEDILESIAEAKYYREKIFICEEKPVMQDGEA